MCLITFVDSMGQLLFICIIFPKIVILYCVEFTCTALLRVRINEKFSNVRLWLRHTIRVYSMQVIHHTAGRICTKVSTHTRYKCDNPRRVDVFYVYDREHVAHIQSYITAGYHRMNPSATIRFTFYTLRFFLPHWCRR